MDELRRELEGERKAWPGFGVTGLVNWLRDAANATRAASPLQAAYRALTRGSTSRQSEEGASHQDLDGADLDPVAVQQLQAILMGSRGSIVKLIRRCPRVLEMERKELIVRLVGAKTLFPACDVARMVELAPDAFLQGPWPAKAQQLQEASTLLQQQLQGADLSAMFSEDPMILFEPLDSLTVGLDRLHELWPGLTPQTLANSSPLHLSLAVKALGLQGPPKGF
ncbi:hypothetical protein D9Q98_004613 [Chlorella vulgaris]|uniref:Uncharacterized protein n=1 Tax=Chlorella vulgaris TaxID=3077 RepID=A0A9D4TQA0_CHLVU|nr:hypothetical protein D9Q98_004613 [Chlorella vulgaris]